MNHARGGEKGQAEAEQKNPDIHFGRDVGERLYRMTPCQNAVTKVRIQQVLLDVEFPSEQYYIPATHGSTLPQYTSYFTTNSNTYQL